MDISINKHLTYRELDDFLKAQVNCSYFIVCDREANDWDNFNQEQLILQYFHEEDEDRFLPDNTNKTETDLACGFKYGISIYPIKPEAEYILILENFARRMAKHFDCSTCCDASRVVLANSLYYSLLCENDKVYLADDVRITESGCVKKIAELSYSLPTVECFAD